MKKLFHILVLLLFFKQLNAQDESLFSRINGVNLKENIYIKWDNTKSVFRYSNETIDSWHDVGDDLIFKVKNDNENNFKVYLEFYNPLRYSIKSESKDLDDPAFQAINEFISKLPTLPNIPSTEENKDDPAISTGSRHGGTVPKELKQSILLHEWIYQFSQVIDHAVISSSSGNSKEFDELIDLINKLDAANKYLFDKISIANIPEYTDTLCTINEWIKKRSYILYDADNDYAKFNKEYETSVKVYNGLLTSMKDADDSFKEIIDLLSSKFDDKISKFIKVDRKDDFEKYSNSTSVWLSMNNINRFDINKQAIDKFKTYLDKLDSHIKKYTIEVCDSKGKNCNHYFEDYDIKLNWKSEKMQSFKYEIKKLDKEGAEVAQSSSSGEFIVGKKLFFYPFVSTGILYTGFKYPNYTISTDNGVNSVGKAPDTKVYVRPALFLNFLIASWDPIYPFFQVGVTTGVKDVIFPVGLGFTIGNSFSISGGPMIGYRKDLNKLQVGDPVKDETTLENDLTYKGIVSGYFSINYTVGKK